MNENSDKIKIVDLFSCSGAFSYLFNSTNICKCVYSNDCDKNCEYIYIN